MLAVRHFYLFVQSRDFTLVAAPDNARENKYFTNNVMNAVHHYILRSSNEILCNFQTAMVRVTTNLLC
jgi:hypothetical protein